jgi:hypothetical protein
MALVPSVLAKTNRHEATQTTIRGVASDSAGEPLVGATVVLQTFDGQIVSTSATDGSGRFAFESRGRADLIIVVNKSGYSTEALSVPINSVWPLHITMEPESGDAGGGGM